MAPGRVEPDPVGLDAGVLEQLTVGMAGIGLPVTAWIDLASSVA